MLTIEELYQYSSGVRRKFLEKLEGLRWETVTKNREASFYSMRNIFLHMIDNEDWIVNWVIHDKGLEYQRVKWEEYTDMRMIREHLEMVEGKTKAYMVKADEKELQRRVNFTLSSGAVFDLSVEESLFQSFTEQLYHLGELIALLWQEDIEPPRMQWFWNNPRTAAPERS
jgi:uncharacterized damage-inducible protein DinB